MSWFRLLCLWLVMLALPLQGLAAASMVYCGAQADAAAVASHESSSHDHATHGHGAAPDETAASSDENGNASHKCLMCAFCGHAVAINQFPEPLEFGSSLHASPPEPVVLIRAVAVLLPDKPPRA
jgi:hypothetical protein